MILSCGRPAGPVAARGPSRDLAPFLVDPTTGDPLARGDEVVAAVRRLHGDLLRGSSPAAIEAAARDLLARDPGLHPALVVIGQAALAGGRLAPARAALAAVVSELPDYVAAQLALGRASELAGDLVAAAEAYRAAMAIPLAAKRAEELAAAASEALRFEIRAALERGEGAEARDALARLERLALEDRRTREAAADTRLALGDRVGELEALRWLAPSAEGDRAWVERRAAAELAVGDPSSAVALLEALALRFPGDRSLLARLGAAKTRWRLALLPPQVAEVSERPELSRADLAVLLYWWIPEVRTARPTAVAIATDVHDSPHRVEVVRAINLGLLSIDESLHLFSPWRSARREEALLALLRAQSLRHPVPSCAGPAVEGSTAPGTICAAAVACGWLREAAECLPTAPVSGAEFLAWASAAEE